MKYLFYDFLLCFPARFTDSQRQNVKIYETHDENYDENHKLEITREDLVVDENIALDEKLLDKPEIEVGGHAPSKLRLLEVLYKTFGGLFVAGVCLNIMHDLLMFASPYIFKWDSCVFLILITKF